MMTTRESDEDFEMSLQDDDGDLPSIMAEMDALQAVFEADFRKGPIDRARSLARHALDLRPPPTTVEGRLTVVALSHCLGLERADLALIDPPKKGPWGVRTFNALATGWMRWVTLSDTKVLDTIAKMHGEDESDEEAETLSLNFWARAIELLIQGRRAEAQKFFERATEVGSQFGTSTNPPICWTYAASFFPGV